VFLGGQAAAGAIVAGFIFAASVALRQLRYILAALQVVGSLLMIPEYGVGVKEKLLGNFTRTFLYLNIYVR
jgi:hypothetical protein